MRDFTKQKLTGATGGRETHEKLDQIDARFAEISDAVNVLRSGAFAEQISATFTSVLSDLRENVAAETKAAISGGLEGLDSEIGRLLGDFNDKLTARVTRLILLEESQFESLTVKLDYLTRRVEELGQQVQEAAHSPAVSGARRKRIALVSPMPPAASGVADYSAALLPELAKWVDVDVFAQAGAVRQFVPGVNWFDYSEFDLANQARGEYAELIVAMGNSPFHQEPFRILKKHGGTVLAHDVRYSGFWYSVANDAPDLKSKPDLLGQSQNADGTETGVVDHVNALQCEAVFEPASRVVVHSDSASLLAKMNLPPSERAKVETVTFGHRNPNQATGDWFRNGDAVTSLGIVDSSKESRTVLEAFNILAQRFPDLEFAIVGGGDPGFLNELKTENERLGSMVTITGRVSEPQWAKWLERSKLTVQLRSVSNGESSAAVSDALAEGIPVIASRIGSFAELGDAVVLVEPEISVDALVEEIEGLLNDDVRLADLTNAGLRLAARDSFARAAFDLVKPIFEGG